MYPDLSRARGRYPKPAYQISVSQNLDDLWLKKLLFFITLNLLKTTFVSVAVFREDYKIVYKNNK